MEFYPAPDGVAYGEIIDAITALLRRPFDALRACLRRQHGGLAHI